MLWGFLLPLGVYVIKPTKLPLHAGGLALPSLRQYAFSDLVFHLTAEPLLPRPTN